MTENRRRFSRIHFVTDANLQIRESWYEAYVLDLSLKGALVQISQPPKGRLAAAAKIQFRLEGSNILLEFRGKLVHREDDRLGYSFTEMDLDSMRHLRKLLEYNLGDPAQLKREVRTLCDELTQTAD
jgi:hypothetical protein